MYGLWRIQRCIPLLKRNQIECILSWEIEDVQAAKMMAVKMLTQVGQFYPGFYDLRKFVSISLQLSFILQYGYSLEFTVIEVGKVLLSR